MDDYLKHTFCDSHMYPRRLVQIKELPTMAPKHGTTSLKYRFVRLFVILKTSDYCKYADWKISSPASGGSLPYAHANKQKPQIMKFPMPAHPVRR